MERLTFFTTSRAFRGHFNIIQRNAVRSWMMLVPRPDIFLMGADAGIGLFAQEIGARYFPDVKAIRDLETDSLVPYVYSTFKVAETNAATEWMCRINADIVLMNDFSVAFTQLREKLDRFLMVGRRHTVRVTELLGFSVDWQDRLRERVATEGRADPRTGVDYFVYPKGLYPQEAFPAFIQARQGCDGWLVWYANRIARIPTVEVSEVVLAVHQDHERTMPYGRREVMTNRALAPGLQRLWDCSHSLTKDGLKTGTRPRG